MFDPLGSSQSSSRWVPRSSRMFSSRHARPAPSMRRVVSLEAVRAQDSSTATTPPDLLVPSSLPLVMASMAYWNAMFAEMRESICVSLRLPDSTSDWSGRDSEVSHSMRTGRPLLRLRIMSLDWPMYGSLEMNAFQKDWERILSSMVSRTWSRVMGRVPFSSLPKM